MDRYTEILMKKYNCDTLEELNAVFARDKKYNSRFRHDLTGQDEEDFNEE